MEDIINPSLVSPGGEKLRLKDIINPSLVSPAGGRRFGWKTLLSRGAERDQNIDADERENYEQRDARVVHHHLRPGSLRYPPSDAEGENAVGEVIDAGQSANDVEAQEDRIDHEAVHARVIGIDAGHIEVAPSGRDVRGS